MPSQLIFIERSVHQILATSRWSAERHAWRNVVHDPEEEGHDFLDDEPHVPWRFAHDTSSWHSAGIESHDRNVMQNGVGIEAALEFIPTIRRVTYAGVHKH